MRPEHTPSEKASTYLHHSSKASNMCMLAYIPKAAMEQHLEPPMMVSPSTKAFGTNSVEKNLISELVSYYHTSNVNGVPQIVAQSHPEKLRLLLGKQTYVTLTSEKEVFVSIQTFDHAMQTINGIDGSTSQQWTVVPGANGISLNFDQWYKLTSLESLFAIEHLKALAKVPVILKAKKRSRSPSWSPPTLSKLRKVNLKLDIPPATTLETIKEEEEEEEETKPTTVI